MKDIIFSVNIVIPVFVIIILGFFLRRKGIITDEFITAATTIVFYLALPAKLFQDVCESDFYSLMDLKYILYIVGVTTLAFLCIWIIAAIFIKDKSKIGAFVHGAFRGNYVYLGLPILQNILQKDVVQSSILVVAFVLPMYNILSVILLSYYNEQKDRGVNAKKLLLSIITNPMIVAIAAALPFSLLKVQFPSSITKSINYLGVLATPLALLLVGASIKFDLFVRNFKYIIGASLLKVIIQPLLFVPLAVLLGFHSEEVVTLYVMLAVPAAMNTYIMTKKMGGDGELSAGIIVMTVIISSVTIPVGAYLLRVFGII